MATANSSSLVFGAPSKSSKTVRIELDLFEPNAEAFPEFNYSKLVHVEKKKKKKIDKVNGFADPFGDNDDDVARIAKEFERKYSNAYAGKNSGIGKGGAAADCYDKGTGYDENDDFIDNTDAYDENVPDGIDTDRGGFYINSGSLVFKPLANFERPEDALRMPKPRKRALSTSSESSVEEDPSNKVATNTAPTKNGHTEKKAKVHDKPRPPQPAKKDEPAADPAKKVVKTTTVKDMLRAKRDSMRNMHDGGIVLSSDDAGSRSGSSDGSNSEDEEEDDDDDDEDDDEDDQHDDTNGEHGEKMETEQTSNKKEPLVNGAGPNDEKLPNNLPANLVAYINQLTDSAKSSTGTKSFFDPFNTEILYQIDILARNVGGVARNSIYNYLERFLPCTKQTLQMRAKKCRLQREDAKTEKVVKLLQAAVNATMPEVHAEYEADCQRIAELRAEAIRLGESKETIAALKMPKRRFKWNEATRSLNCEIFNSRRTSFLVLKPRKETIDEFVNRYIREHVLRVWPDGYMRLDELIREYEKSNKMAKKPKDRKPDTPQPKSNTSPTIDTATPTVKDHKAAVAPSDTFSKDPSKKKTSPPVFQPSSVVPIITQSSYESTPGAKSLPHQSQPDPTATKSTSTSPSNSVNKSSHPSSTPSTTNTPPTNVAPSSFTSSISSLTSTTTTTNSTTTTIITSDPMSILSPVDLSPPKRSTDHSINSIISPSAIGVPQNHSKTPTPPLHLHLNHGQSPPTTASGPPTPTHDERPPPTQSRPASAAASNPHVFISSSSETSPLRTSVSVTDDVLRTTSHAPAVDVPSELRIRSVVTLNQCLDNDKSSSPAHKSNAKPEPELKRSASAVIEELSSDSSSSDDVEFVSEITNRPEPMVKVKTTGAPLSIQVNRQKYMQRHQNGTKVEGGSSDETSTKVADSDTNNELDVNQIMRELKELQKLQSNSSNPTGGDKETKKDTSIGCAEVAKPAKSSEAPPPYIVVNAANVRRESATSSP